MFIRWRLDSELANVVQVLLLVIVTNTSSHRPFIGERIGRVPECGVRRARDLPNNRNILEGEIIERIPASAVMQEIEAPHPLPFSLGSRHQLQLLTRLIVKIIRRVSAD